jgi:hypothetical protein
MEAVSTFTFAASILRLCVVFLDEYAREFVRCYQLCKLYGETGIPLFSSETVLGQLKEEDALAFKESVYYECTMIAVSVGLLSLNLLEP